MFKRSKRKADNELANTQKHSLTKIVISLVIAIIAWVGATSIESYLLSDKNTSQLIVANKDIEDGTVFSKKNRNQYFTKTIVNSSLVTSSSITDINQIKGKADIKIDKGEIITANMFHDSSYVNKKIKDPVEITFSAKDIENSVVGTLREGDLVNIIVTVTDPTSGSTSSSILYSNVYLLSVYDDSYTKIESDNKTANAVYFKIYIEKGEQTNFAKMLSEGNITITKVK